MKLSEMLHKIHKRIEDKEIQAIAKKDMAQRLGVSNITYIEWLRGVNEPLGMIAILNMLTMLDDDKIVMNIRNWEYNKKTLRLFHMFYKIHKQIEDIEIKPISQKEMSNRLGISLSAYTSWLGGTKEPLAMIALLDMLTMIDDEGLVECVREWGESKIGNDFLYSQSQAQ